MYDAETKLRDLLHDAAPDTGAVPFDPIARRVARRRNRLVVAASALTAGTAVSAMALLPQPSNDQIAVPPSTTSSGSTIHPMPTNDCVTGPQAGNVIVDYVDFVRYGGRTYRATGREIEPRPMPSGASADARRSPTAVAVAGRLTSNRQTRSAPKSLSVASAWRSLL